MQCVCVCPCLSPACVVCSSWAPVSVRWGRLSEPGHTAESPRAETSCWTRTPFSAETHNEAEDEEENTSTPEQTNQPRIIISHSPQNVLPWLFQKYLFTNLCCCFETLQTYITVVSLFFLRKRKYIKKKTFNTFVDLKKLYIYILGYT